MSRPKSQSRSALLDNALSTFWKMGYHVVSMGDLVRETGVSRGGIYSDFKGKRELFHACLEHYQDTFVGSSLAPIEADGSGIAAIAEYLETLISSIEQSGEGVIGCLVVNTSAQLDPNDTETHALLERHFKRQENAFHAAISNENNISKKLSETEVSALAQFVTTSIQGLAARFRNTTDIKPLRQYADSLMQILKVQLHNDQ
ncbi:TetR/AcrR family transcriptional regulator [Pseudoalteromonas sp. S3178]|uniref:TetR/AcrR family transcriptional regulator n=1 Tax=Pseudoalteromonas sp. S3178 TaxID=579532 RepID=UPI00110ABF85|nr:TetR/AcrR family transcriptional regulator [Pseudoalteromonas sp. S3178]TMP07855.1 TetR/AcrR family transcriptional regulator [Pseudoalteromonas sp. S3178]